MRFLASLLTPGGRRGKALDAFSFQLCDEAEARRRLATSQEGHLLCEYLRQDCTGAVKLYLDRDHYLPEAVPGSEEAVVAGAAAKEEGLVRARVEVLLHRLAALAAVPRESLSYVLATRHGWCAPKRRWKLSFRPFVAGLRLSAYPAIPALLARLVPEQLAEGFWDLSVYKAAEQPLATLHGIKSSQDPRPLQPERPTDDPLLYLAQHVQPAWPLLQLEKPGSSSSGHTRAPPARPCPVAGPGPVPGPAPKRQHRAPPPAAEVLPAEAADPALAEALTGLIADSYAADYSTWVRVGLALKRSGGSYAAFEAFSRRCPAKFDGPDACRRFWDGLDVSSTSPADGAASGGGGVTLGTLAHYARASDPVGCAAAMAASASGSAAVARPGPSALQRTSPPACSPSSPGRSEEVLRLLQELGVGVGATSLTLDGGASECGLLRYEVLGPDGPERGHICRETKHVFDASGKFLGNLAASRSPVVRHQLCLLHNAIPVTAREFACAFKSGSETELCAAPSNTRITLLSEPGDQSGGYKMARVHVDGRAEGMVRSAKLLSPTYGKVMGAINGALSSVLSPEAAQLVGVNINFNFNGPVNVLVQGQGRSEEREERRTDEELVRVVMKEQPQLLERLRHAPDIKSSNCNGIYYCDPETNVWSQEPNMVLEKLLVGAYGELGKAGLVSAADLRHAHSFRGRNQLLYVLATQAVDKRFSERLNANPDVFAVANGLFEVRTRRFRPLEPGDYVSGTAGWSYDAAAAAEHRGSLERFLSEVLPVAEERRVVLAFFASLLSGRRVEKKFLVLTDQRAGNNGKSTLLRLLRLFFGAYASVNTTFVCKGSFDRDAEAHSGGTEALAGKRLLVAEELKRNMKLDVAKLKMYTGGEGVSASDRRFGSGATFEYTWQAGVVLVFNEGDCPQFDATDGAFAARMVVAPMRSKFVAAEALAALRPDEREEYTYAMDLAVQARFPAWLPALAELLLEHYDEGALLDGRIPESMKEWRRGIEGGANPLSAWVEERLTVTGKREDYVLLKDLKAAYEGSPRSGPPVPAKDVSRLLVAKLNGLPGVVVSMKNDKVRGEDGQWRSAYGLIRGVVLA